MSHFVLYFCTRTQFFFHFLLWKRSNIHKSTENSTITPMYPLPTYNDHQIIAFLINCFERDTKCVILLKVRTRFKNHKYNTLLLYPSDPTQTNGMGAAKPNWSALCPFGLQVVGVVSLVGWGWPISPCDYWWWQKLAGCSKLLWAGYNR